MGLKMKLLQPDNLFFLVGFAIYIGIRHHFIQQTRGEKKVVSMLDGLERLLLAGLVPGTLVLPLLYLLTPVLDFANYERPSVLGWAGAAALAASLGLFWRSHVDLGRNWSVSVELREGHELVTSGVYRRIRHPMYASIWLWSFAQGLLLQNWLAGWGMLPAFALLYVIRTPHEERLMLRRFGERYREYMQVTGRLIPPWLPGDRV